MPSARTPSRADQVQGRTGEPLTYRASCRATASTTPATFDTGGIRGGASGGANNRTARTPKKVCHTPALDWRDTPNVPRALCFRSPIPEKNFARNPPPMFSKGVSPKNMRLIFSSRFSTHPECRHQVFRANAATVRHGGRWRMSAGGAPSLRLTIAHGQWWATVGNGQGGTGFAPSRARGRLFRAAFWLAIDASRRNAPPKPRRLRSRLSA